MYSNVDIDFIFQGRHSTYMYMYKVTHIYILKTEISNTDFEIRENMLHIVIQRDQHLRERKHYVWLERNKEKRWQESDSYKPESEPEGVSGQPQRVTVTTSNSDRTNSSEQEACSAEQMLPSANQICIVEIGNTCIYLASTCKQLLCWTGVRSRGLAKESVAVISCEPVVES